MIESKKSEKIGILGNMLKNDGSLVQAYAEDEGAELKDFKELSQRLLKTATELFNLINK